MSETRATSSPGTGSLIPLVGLILTIVLLAPTPAVRADEPVVRAVFFWSSSCPHCHEVLEQHLPPLEEQYGDQLDIQTIEIVGPERYELWLAAVEALEVPPERRGVPMLFIGSTVLVGSREIPEQLPIGR